MTGICFKGVFEGIYEYGRGYASNDVRLRWEAFWKAFAETPAVDGRECFNWAYVEASGPSRAGCLANTHTGISVYMHPTGFSGAALKIMGAITSTGIDGDYNTYYTSHFEFEMTELADICRAAAAACGGTFKLFLSKEFEVPQRDRDDVHEVTSRDDYIKKVAFQGHPR